MVEWTNEPRLQPARRIPGNYDVKLFSATYTLDTYTYMEDTFRGTQVFFNIIWASNWEHALDILKKTFPEVPYGTYSVPVNIKINEALGVQPMFA